MRVFADTNVLVYAADPADAGKHRRAGEWVEALWVSGAGRISVQVVKEFYATATRKLRPGLTPGEAAQEIRDLWSWNPVLTDLPLLERAWRLEALYNLSFWDAMIVAAAQIAGCEVLLTEDLQDGQDFDGTRIRSPFTALPADVLA